MTRTLLVAGTASHVGKSTVVAGLCRHLADCGVDVAPFKAQNMSNNARVALRPDGGWGEIGVSQFVQARAARVPPTTDLNPVLLKPRGAGESQLVVDGETVGNVRAGEYYESEWERARTAAERAFHRLAAEHELVVAEGAGGLGEINLHDRDLANVETARFADADVLLLADVERGGAFASLYGTLELVPGDVGDRVVGTAMTKFRGDESLLREGVEELEARTGVPLLGVLAYDDPGLPAEDSVGLPDAGKRRVLGADDGVPDEQAVTVAVPRLPRISNFTDLEPLAAEPGVRVAYVPLSDSLDDADAVVVTGTKNTVDDLLAAREAGLEEALVAFSGPVVGVCGGYQLLGERLTDAHLEGTGAAAVVPGLGLLPVETRFSPAKRVERVSVDVEGVGPIDGAAGTAVGYEIHHGVTTATGPVDRPMGPGSARRGRVLGTYLHGLFEHRGIRRAFVEAAYGVAGREPPSAGSASPSPHDRAAELVRASIDLAALGLPGVPRSG